MYTTTKIAVHYKLFVNAANDIAHQAKIDLVLVIDIHNWCHWVYLGDQAPWIHFEMLIEVLQPLQKNMPFLWADSF